MSDDEVTPRAVTHARLLDLFGETLAPTRQVSAVSVSAAAAASPSPAAAATAGPVRFTSSRAGESARAKPTPTSKEPFVADISLGGNRAGRLLKQTWSAAGDVDYVPKGKKEVAVTVTSAVPKETNFSSSTVCAFAWRGSCLACVAQMESDRASECCMYI